MKKIFIVGLIVIGLIACILLVMNYIPANKKNDINDIHSAASAGNVEKVKYFLDKGADVNIKDEYGRTPLHRVNDSIFVFENFIEKDEADKMRPEGIKIVKILLDAGADVNSKDDNGETPLHNASSAGALESVRLLLAAGADVKAKDKYGNTPLHDMKGSGYMDLYCGYEEPFSAAGYMIAGDEQPEIAKLLLDAGADVNATDEQGETPLYQVSGGHGFGPKQEGIQMEVLKLLIANGADVNIKNNNNHTALHEAFKQGYTEIVKLLIANGADVLDMERDEQWIEFLKKHGAQRSAEGEKKILKKLRVKVKALKDVNDQKRKKIKEVKN